MDIHTVIYTTLSTRLDEAGNVLFVWPLAFQTALLHVLTAKESASSRPLDFYEAIPCNVFDSGETCPTSRVLDTAAQAAPGTASD